MLSTLEILMRQNILFFSFLLISLCSHGQDIHFTQWMHAPHTYSPAETGDFDGQHRFIANRRSQWSSVTVPFRTFSIMADSRFWTKNHNLGLGGGIIYDVTGDSRFTTAKIHAGASYFINLPQKKGAFTIGVQPSFTQKKIDMKDLYFDEQFNGNYYDPNLPNSEKLYTTSRWYFDFAAGIQGQLKLNANNLLELGFSLYNILQPNQSFFNELDIPLDIRTNGFMRLNRGIGKKLVIQPGVLYSKQGKFQSLNIGANFYYDISQSKFLKQTLFAGLYGRTKDSGDLIIGMEYGNWTFAFSYDINFSDLVPASNYRGGYEIGIIYILRKELKRPEYKTCPSYL